ncbi:methyl-accepting chemotaxis protein [Allocoleopsis franciscana]|uniref:Methyl-accepting chemotaxis protein n=1 Tax=Allocoleopsis franciscana PCC 7113 TaxID=1173027 RepID=K9WAP5_9CYAN|nr:methyl-accepting chemotaxis protein [Allocoleopsis franciscana]AFZ17455.1 methyl-accepting chemotaxis protein [Allocoleopsis franciscana PCC 7113]
MTGIELPSVASTSSPNLSYSKKHKSLSLKWFENLPVRGKQLTGLFTSEVISIVGLVGVGAVLIVAAGRTQLVRQAESELAVAQINYDFKINQMESSFRAQSDNAAIITAAIAHAQNQPLTPELRGQIKQILKNEAQASNIEYATLVGKDRRIIVNANADRTGETFDPNNLVSQVLSNSQPLQASQIISGSDLSKESPPLAQGLANQDALIRYTITPVKDPKTGSVVGTLVSGDVVNGKLSMVENTVKAFGGGYSAVYARQPSGKFALATALDQGIAKDVAQAKPNVPLFDPSVLEKAVAAPNQVVTGRAVAGTQSYTVAAKALSDVNGKPVAVLVRGTEENALNKLLGDSLLLQLAVSALTLAVDVGLAVLLGRTIAQPIKRLQQTTQRFARGDRQVRAKALTNDEVGQLAHTFNELADSIVLNERVLEQQARYQKAEAERSQAFAEFTSRLYKSLDVQDILNTVVNGVRDLLQVERVLVYSFQENYRNGTVTAESVVSGWMNAIDLVSYDLLETRDIEQFKTGQVVICNDIYDGSNTVVRFDILQHLQVKATMIAPLFLGNNLLGLLCVQQCSEPRNWQPQEIALFQQAQAQSNLALQQAHLIEQLKRARQEAELGRQKAIEFAQVEQARQVAELTSIEQRQQKEELQHQVLTLLQDIEASADGDFTVRANVTEGTIGTVADFFNAIIENLRQIVWQVQQTAIQVNSALQVDEQSVEQLSLTALKQADEISQSLESILAMTSSIQAVAENARQAAAITRIASTAAQTGGKAIDSTVNNIVNLRERVVETTNKAKVLDESSQEIAKVVTLVQEISLKTNLLAINAGLEASRAGAEGEGFRVVADQIGKLAKQSVSATKEIEQVLEVIQQNTKGVVEAMEEGRTQVINSTEMILDVRQSLEEIFEVSHQIDGLVQSISDATVSQAQTSQIVTALMQEIAQISQQTSDSSLQVSSSLRQTVEVAQYLQQSVGRFKIGSFEDETWER